jgi:hypothetical protein
MKRTYELPLIVRHEPLSTIVAQNFSGREVE